MTKFSGIFPAFYACYDDNGDVSKERTKKFVEYLISQNVNGLYVCGSSGECIYQSVEERMQTLEAVMEVAKGRIKIIAHVACNNTKDSQKLASHAESLGVDAIAAIPPIYFHLPEHGIAQYWNDISAAAPNTDFVIYNIPQLAGVALTPSLLKEMLKNPRVVAVKNSSMPTQDIQMWKMYGGENFTVFNGPDEQLISGLAIGADGGIGGTYAVMPELYIKLYELVQRGNLKTAREIQNICDKAIYTFCGGKSNLYAVMKEIIKRRVGIELGGVRKPLSNLFPEDEHLVCEGLDMIVSAVKKYC